jgi:predicted CXXCH cytochrome family protein
MLLSFFALDAQSAETAAAAPSDNGMTINDVHTWPGSTCDFCHVSSKPDAGSAELIVPDQSSLCDSCHTVANEEHHIIKFSPLKFDPKMINQNISVEGKHFYISGDKGKLPLFGASRETAVAECSTCHDPHGRSGRRNLLRIDNANSALCFTCHLY